MHKPATVVEYGRREGVCAEACPAFTLVEILVVLVILALLMALLIPSLNNARQKVLTVLCSDQGRVIATEFRIFADEYGHGYRGDSEVLGNRFDGLDFLESLYEVGEFSTGTINEFQEYEHGKMPLLCPGGPRGLGRHVNKQELWKPFAGPREQVNYAMNRRLFLAPVEREDGTLWETPVTISERIFDYPYVPLMFDVDGAAAMSKVGHIRNTHLPFFSAPYLPGDEYWFPAKRHQGKVNIVFIGGYVITTDDPLKGREEAWKYHPPIDNPPVNLRSR